MLSIKRCVCFVHSETAVRISQLDSVAPKLFKFAGDSIIPSLLSVFNISATCSDTVLATWKTANISLLSSKVTMKLISILTGLFRF